MKDQHKISFFEKMAPAQPKDDRGMNRGKKSIAPITATSRLRNDYMR